MTEERWTEADDALVQYESLPDGHPVVLTDVFWLGLEDPTDCLRALTALVTPESLDDWGDFRGLESEATSKRYGVLTSPRQRAHANDVAWVGLAARGTGAHFLRPGEVIAVPYVFTWIWRPELGGWRLHAIGSDGIEPELLPRSAPHQAPSLGSARVI